MLEELCKKHGAKKGEDRRSAHFMTVYEKHFFPMRVSPIKLLEIGVQGGGSVKMWAEYFFNGYITGIDIKKKCKQYADKRIEVLLGDQADSNFLSTLGEYDIVIDDGGHTMKQQTISLNALWTHLNPGGIYVIEDLETSYWPQFKGGYGREGTTVEWLKSWVDYLNVGVINHKRAEKYRQKWPNLGIESIHFYPSICFIHKCPK
jgi:hypothetical protein